MSVADEWLGWWVMRMMSVADDKGDNKMMSVGDDECDKCWLWNDDNERIDNYYSGDKIIMMVRW
jgi:hypothetical protein